MAKRLTAQLFVSRLYDYSTDQSLRQLFALFGLIRECFDLITFESEDDAQKAMKALDGKIVDGRLIFVEDANEVEAPKTNMNSDKA